MKIVFFGEGAAFSMAHVSMIQREFPLAGIVETAPRGCTEERAHSIQKRSTLYKFAKKHHIPYLYTLKSSSLQVEGFLRSTCCDLICVASMPGLLKENIIQIPEKGIINAHPAKLPYYRGPDPSFWIFYNGEVEGGCTIHYIDVGEDTGGILAQECFPIPFDMTYEEYTKKIMEISPRLMVQVIREIEAGTAVPHPQPYIEGLSRARRLMPEDYRIDFSEWDVRRAYHLLNGTGRLNIILQEPYKKVTVTGFSQQPATENCKSCIRCKNGTVFYRASWTFRKAVKRVFVAFGLMPASAVPTAASAPQGQAAGEDKKGS